MELYDGIVELVQWIYCLFILPLAGYISTKVEWIKASFKRNFFVSDEWIPEQISVSVFLVTLDMFLWWNEDLLIQLTFTYSKSIMETLKKGVKYVIS